MLFFSYAISTDLKGSLYQCCISGVLGALYLPDSTSSGRRPHFNITALELACSLIGGRKLGGLQFLSV